MYDKRMPKPKPCPFCGYEGISFCEAVETDGEYYYFWGCNNDSCLADGPCMSKHRLDRIGHDTAKKALLKLWNRRAGGKVE